jgi:hypothetical protein
VMAAVRAAEHVMSWMEASGGGSILFVSSSSGLEADPSPDFGYTAAKAALIAHAKKLAVMHAPRGIRVNAPMWRCFCLRQEPHGLPASVSPLMEPSIVGCAGQQSPLQQGLDAALAGLIAGHPPPSASRARK